MSEKNLVKSQVRMEVKVGTFLLSNYKKQFYFRKCIKLFFV